MNELCSKRMDLKDKKIQQKEPRGMAQLLALFLHFLVIVFIYSKLDDPHQKQFEKYLVLFIAKELVPLSFADAMFLGD